MSYEKEITWEGNTILFEYSLGDAALILDTWSLWAGNIEIVPTRETADEINILLENWLEKEYSNSGWNYEQDYISSQFEKRWEAAEDR